MDVSRRSNEIMNNIFISYRHTDSQDATGRIHDHLDMYFDREVAFRDIDRLHAGTDFPGELNKALAQCSLVIGVIGDQWLNVTYKDGTERLKDPKDLVRIELATALSRGVPVIPVLIGSAGMPSAEQLPSDLERLAYKQAIHIPSSRGFVRGIRQLVEEIHQLTALPFEDFPNVITDCQRAGLVLVKDNFREDTSVLDEMKTTRELLVVMNDGRGWVDQNRDIIYGRLRDPDKVTRVALHHPASPFLETLIRKNRKTLATQIEEIKRSYESLQNYEKSQGQLYIRGHMLFNGYSLTLGDRYAFVSPYFFNESGALPLLKFSSRVGQGLYQELRADAMRLFDTAVPLTQENFRS
jgi:hypothetical protein